MGGDLAEDLQKVLDQRAEVLLGGSHACEGLDVEPHHLLGGVAQAGEERGPDLLGELHHARPALAQQHVHPLQRGEQRRHVLRRQVAAQRVQQRVHLKLCVLRRLQQRAQCHVCALGCLAYLILEMRERGQDRVEHLRAERHDVLAPSRDEGVQPVERGEARELVVRARVLHEHVHDGREVRHAQLLRVADLAQELGEDGEGLLTDLLVRVGEHVEEAVEEDRQVREQVDVGHRVERRDPAH